MQWWALDRVKDRDRFMVELDRPPPGVRVTVEDLDADAASFMAFTTALGVAPPGGRRPAQPEGVPSDPSV